MSFGWGLAGVGNFLGQAAVAVNCTTAPLDPRYKSLFPGSINTFQFDHTFSAPATQSPWTTAEMAAVEEGFRLWNEANTTLSQAFPPGVLGTQVNEDAVTSTPTVWVRNVFMGPDVNTSVVPVGQFNLFNVAANPASWDGYIRSVLHHPEILFNTDQKVLSSYDGYLKTALQEIGHLMGMGEAYVRLPNGKYQHKPPGSTVMNPTGGLDDLGGLQSKNVTSCDQTAAKLYGTRPWP